jgi:hypothetical protein
VQLHITFLIVALHRPPQTPDNAQNIKVSKLQLGTKTKHTVTPNKSEESIHNSKELIKPDAKTEND